MRSIDFVFYVAFKSAQKNGWGDTPVPFGKLVVSAVLVFIYVLFLNILHLLELEFSRDLFISFYPLIFALIIILILVHVRYNAMRVECVKGKFKLEERSARIYFNLIFMASLIFLFITTILIGPKV